MKIMNKKGIGVLELIVIICSIVASVGGLYLQGDDPPAPAQHVEERVIVIDLSGNAHEAVLEPGKSYDATIMPDGRLIVREKK
jgi:hypothetical protein